MVVSDGLGMRVLILVLALLTALQIALVGGSAWLRVRDFGVPLRPALVAQTVATIELLEATPAEEHARVLRAVNSPLVRYRLVPTFPAEDPHPGTDAASSHLAQVYERALAPRAFYAYEREPPPGGTRPPPPPGAGDGAERSRSPQGGAHAHRRPRHRALRTGGFALIVQLDGGGALVMEASPLHRRQLALSLILVISSVVGLALLAGLIWASLATSRPLARMAQGITAFADDLHAQPLEERGPGPVRRVAAAFNRLQGGLRRLVEQRTMTLAAIAHDYRTYLMRLRLRAEYITDETQREKAIADIDEMSALLDDTLAYARHASATPGGGQAREAPTALDLVPLLRDVLEPHEAAGAAVTLQVEDPPGEDARVAVAGPPLRRALANLVENAVRYGRGAHLVVALVGAPAQQLLTVTVRDEGAGVPAEALAKLTEPFYRIEDSRSRETGGAGLGLAITDALIESLGGKLSLTSAPGEGLVARVILPMAAD
ncbi:MAG: ATP-binding protein [Pseudomonadota bacterium]